MDGLGGNIRLIYIIISRTSIPPITSIPPPITLFGLLIITFLITFLLLLLLLLLLLFLLLLLLLLLLIVIIIMPTLLLVSVLGQKSLLMCIGALILEISLDKFFNRPTMWESV